MKLLIMRLEAPLMKWGLRSLWNDRDTHIVPTKSGVIGLISCAMGLKRGDKKIVELSKRLNMGVRADRRGYFLTDLQIVSSNSNPYIGHLCNSAYKQRTGEGGLLTYRHYIQDACYTVVLSGDESVLENAAKALCDPIFPVYLGTKCCVPSRPVFEALTEEYTSVADALCRYPLAEKRMRDRKEDTANCYCEIESENGLHIRQDEIAINDMREYGYRRVDVKYLGG